MTNPNVDQQGWVVEELQRRGRTVLVFYHNGDVRGQIECETTGEREGWLRAVKTLNSEAESKR